MARSISIRYVLARYVEKKSIWFKEHKKCFRSQTSLPSKIGTQQINQVQLLKTIPSQIQTHFSILAQAHGSPPSPDQIMHVKIRHEPASHFTHPAPSLPNSLNQRHSRASGTGFGLGRPGAANQRSRDCKQIVLVVRATLSPNPNTFGAGFLLSWIPSESCFVCVAFILFPCWKRRRESLSCQGL